MAVIIKPLLNNKNVYESTFYRLGSLFQPIQETKEKESDVVAFLATPVLDYFVLDALFAIDASIAILNATASLLKAAYLWIMNQQSTEELIDDATEAELDDFVDQLDHILNAFVAQTLNVILSTLSLITRPIASLVEAVCPDEDGESYDSPYGQSGYPFTTYA
ncbi:hypothetical protein [Legionella shakespearei]|uniref:Uncharacterized protein n=1 Tax=Legionella shakespearei DSM 23087 TaxID=1122169 RepID=A0A0W0Z2Z3_9GAMM|nr:hypothetical protein [Legionella shakespearei]KTD63215.1 hypothetical protein Lsha_0767 [Legionella shakespearei DSM 23087]